MDSREVMLAFACGLGVFICINIFFDIRIFSGLQMFLLNLANDITDGFGKFNARKYVERRRREAIVKNKQTLISRYNTTVENTIIDLNLPLTLESFTSMLCIGFVGVVLIVLMFLQNITLSVVITISIFIGILTLFVMQSQSIKALKLDCIMDAEDLICPLSNQGVFNAIKKIMESDEYIHESIRPNFQQFINNCENSGYSFRQAMEVLNKQLGPKFDSFAKCAIVFEYNERKGMSDIFLDIVDENSVLREINHKKDKVFRKMNRDFLLKTLIVVLFFLFALSVPDFKDFMVNTTMGKAVNTIFLSIICLSFARCQALQSDLGTGRSGR